MGLKMLVWNFLKILYIVLPATSKTYFHLTCRREPLLRDTQAPKILAPALVWCHPISQRIWNPQPKSFLAKLCAATAGNWKPPFGRIVRLLGGLGNSLGGLIKRQVGAPTGIYWYHIALQRPKICLGNDSKCPFCPSFLCSAHWIKVCIDNYYSTDQVILMIIQTGRSAG